MRYLLLVTIAYTAGCRTCDDYGAVGSQAYMRCEELNRQDAQDMDVWGKAKRDERVCTSHSEYNGDVTTTCK